MKIRFIIALLVALFFILPACKKSSCLSPAMLQGSYRIHIITDSDGVVNPTTYIDTVNVVIESSNTISVNGQYLNYLSETNNSISYQYFHASGNLTYTFWNCGDSIGSEEYAPPIVNPNHWAGRGVKI